jgi:hypothetical protein
VWRGEGSLLEGLGCAPMLRPTECETGDNGHPPTTMLGDYNYGFYSFKILYNYNNMFMNNILYLLLCIS